MLTTIFTQAYCTVHGLNKVSLKRKQMEAMEKTEVWKVVSCAAFRRNSETSEQTEFFRV